MCTPEIAEIILLLMIYQVNSAQGTSYRWSEWIACSGSCSGSVTRYRDCELQSNSGVDKCTVGSVDYEAAATTTTTNAPTTTTANGPTTTTTEAQTTTTTANVPTTTTANGPTTTTTEAQTTTTTANVPTTTTANGPTTTTTEAQTTTTAANGPTTTTANGPTPTTTGNTQTTTSAAIMTSTAITEEANCTCDCNKTMTWSGTLNITKEEAQQIIAQLRQELEVKKDTLSSTIRKKISASDHRASSVAMGWVGSIVLGGVVAMLAISDVAAILIWLKDRLLNCRRTL